LTNGETVTVSNPQEELTAANAEIKRLRELLEARDTPALNNESSDTQRLATVLEALSQRLNGPTESRTAPLQSAKVVDPPLLTNRTNPTFDNWKF